MEFNHTPILKDEYIENLNIHSDGIYVDGTLGGAGHALAVCQKLSKNGYFIGIDQDESAIKVASERLMGQAPKVSIVRNNFKNIKKVLNDLNIEKIDGILLDLGVSSHQLDEPERGFSYQHDTELDMRMDKRQKKSAKNILNEYSQNQLANIIRTYGEEKWAARIAEFIVTHRKEKPLETTGELVDIIKRAIPAKARRTGPHPAKRTFQAVRIEVNNELNILQQTIEDAIDCLNPEGRICVITFHSLEDRIIKQTFKKMENPCTCPPEFPVCVCNKVSKIKIISRKPILPSEEEIKRNPRARSAKLRVAKRICSKSKRSE